MTTKIYVVMGTTGEYSDRTEWAVCAYAHKSMAEKHADEAMLWSHKHGKAAQAKYEHTYKDEDKPNSPWDADYQLYYTRTDYYVMDVSMRDTLPSGETA